MTTATAQIPASSSSSVGAELVDTEGRALPLRGTHLTVHAETGLARVRLTQTFLNASERPCRVHYTLPLPADAAVAGFAFELDGSRTSAVVKPRAEARAQFEKAVLQGQSAALLEQDRTSVFRQELGNVPPGARVDVEVALDQPLTWLAEGAWSFRFPTVIGPRYLGAPGRTAKAARVTVPVASGPVDARAHLEIHIADARVGPVRSPSHRIRAQDGVVRLAEAAGAVLDRDVVVQWPVAELQPGVRVVAGGGREGGPKGSFAVLTVVPAAQPMSPVPRELCFLIDVSGSMHGEPLNQAKRVLLAMIDTLGPQDRLEMVAFANRPERWRRAPEVMDAKGKTDARLWLQQLSSMGCTEMRSGIVAALAGFEAHAARQLVVVTDGYIGFEAEIVDEVRARLPPGCRVHALGVGHGVNRTLTESLARVGGGQELIVAPGEDAEVHSKRLLAATSSPQITELAVKGAALRAVGRRVLPDLFPGTPARIPIHLDETGGRFVLSGRTAEGVWRQEVEVPGFAPGAGHPSAATLFARERVADLEADKSACQSRPVEIDAAIERWGVDAQISTSRTSWVAVRDEATVDPGEPSILSVMPHNLPAGVSAEGVGLRSASFGGGGGAPMILRQPRPSAMSPDPELLDEEALLAEPEGRDEGPSSGSERPSKVIRSRRAGDGLWIRPRHRSLGGISKKSFGPVKEEARPTLRARVRLAQPGLLVLEIELPVALDWPRPTTLVIDEAPVTVLPPTTAAGPLQAKDVLRLALGLDEVPDRFELEGFDVVVEREED